MEPALTHSTFRLPLPGIGLAPPDQPGRACPQCGGKWFNAHQRVIRAVKDPQVSRVVIARDRCKRCGWAGRRYLQGVGPGRQSEGLRQLCAILYSLGFSLETVRRLLVGLGCPLSVTSIRRDIALAGSDKRPDARMERLAVHVEDDGRVSGPDGFLTVRVAGDSTLRRWLELEVGTSPLARQIRWRLQQVGRPDAAPDSHR